MRKGEVIGEYRSDYQNKPDGGLEVRARIRIALKVGPIVLYHFDHDSVETWRHGRLAAVDSDTNDDGTRHHLTIHGQDGALALTVDGKAVTVSAESVPSSLWNIAMLANDRPIFDIVDGQQFKNVTACTTSTPGQTGMDCKITGDLERELRFAADGTLDSVSFTADDGSTVTYRRQLPSRGPLLVGFADR